MERFKHFLADMGKQPTPKHSIDRIDPDARAWRRLNRLPPLLCETPLWKPTSVGDFMVGEFVGLLLFVACERPERREMSDGQLLGRIGGDGRSAIPARHHRRGLGLSRGGLHLGRQAMQTVAVAGSPTVQSMGRKVVVEERPRILVRLLRRRHLFKGTPSDGTEVNVIVFHG
jgi:hypothetical protein